MLFKGEMVHVRGMGLVKLKEAQFWPLPCNYFCTLIIARFVQIWYYGVW